MTPNKNFLNYLWEDWIEMVIGSLNIEQQKNRLYGVKVKLSYKSEGQERLFLQLINEKLTNHEKFTPLNYHKILNSPPFCSSYLNFRKNLPPLTCLLWNLGSSPFTKVRGAGEGGGEGGGNYALSGCFRLFQ